MKCPNCGKNTYEEYNNKLLVGAAGAAVGLFLLGPVGLLGAAVANNDSFTGWKCSSCGYKKANEQTESQKKFGQALGQGLGGVAKNQFEYGYNQALQNYDDDDDDY